MQIYPFPGNIRRFPNNNARNYFLPEKPRERQNPIRPCTVGNIRNRGNPVFPILKNTPIGRKKREKFLCNRDQNVWLMLRVSA